MADFVIIYDTATGRLKAKLAETDQLAAGALAATTSGRAIMADGFIVSAKIGALAIGTGHLANAAITSAKIGAGEIGGGRIVDGGILSGKYAAGSIRTADMGDGQIVSAKIGATAIGTGHLVDALITSAKIAAGIVGGALLQDAGVVSGKVGAGAIISGALAAQSVLSGCIASGTITEDRLSPGISIDIAEYLKEPTYTSEAAISGISCVYLTSGKLINTALPHSGYLPAIGIIGDAVAAALLAPVFYGGRFSHGLLSGIVSGYWGQRVYLAASGQVSLSPPALSGECVQVIGQVADNDSIFVFPEPTFIQIAQ